MEKICPRCGASFICQPENITGCQCVTVKLNSIQREYVKKHYFPNCLCKSCLEEIKRDSSISKQTS
ncbi:cysteine-rich CWC family protein [Parabacteroides bouchesdurhonensis]|uniref:cysteine-rich CWC family protein n=1 Tax=Parabacteroides bouchesdurhonensis TaxID=1936995 RepID=UPI000C824C19|nr:cysteine-rich CWC family protein [Parabacteroides bouchesdurhonensis]